MLRAAYRFAFDVRGRVSPTTDGDDYRLLPGGGGSGYVAAGAQKLHSLTVQIRTSGEDQSQRSLAQILASLQPLAPKFQAWL